MATTDGTWTTAMKAAMARGDHAEVAAMRSSILMLLSLAANPEVSVPEWHDYYDRISDLHGLQRKPHAATLRNGWQHAALQLMR